MNLTTGHTTTEHPLAKNLAALREREWAKASTVLAEREAVLNQHLEALVDVVDDTRNFVATSIPVDIDDLIVVER